jgi:hypothetical protein
MRQESPATRLKTALQIAEQATTPRFRPKADFDGINLLYELDWLVVMRQTLADIGGKEAENRRRDRLRSFTRLVHDACNKMQRRGAYSCQ